MLKDIEHVANIVESRFASDHATNNKENDDNDAVDDYSNKVLVQFIKFSGMLEVGDSKWTGNG